MKCAKLIFQSVWIASFFATILLGVDMGLIVGVVFLLVTVVLRKHNASISVSGKLGKGSLYGDIDRFGKVY